MFYSPEPRPIHKVLFLCVILEGLCHQVNELLFGDLASGKLVVDRGQHLIPEIAGEVVLVPGINLASGGPLLYGLGKLSIGIQVDAGEGGDHARFFIHVVLAFGSIYQVNEEFFGHSQVLGVLVDCIEGRAATKIPSVAFSIEPWGAKAILKVALADFMLGSVQLP